MRTLFVHNNFPAQFAGLATTLAAMPGSDVRAIGSGGARTVPGVSLTRYRTPKPVHVAVHPFARRFQQDVMYAEEIFYAGQALRESGFVPDLIIAHPGWGEALPLRRIFPEARTIVYCEFYYHAQGADVGFDTEYRALGLDGQIRVELRNASQLLALEACHSGLSPTQWQRGLYPSAYRDRIAVVHDGIDTSICKPNGQATLTLPDGRTLTRNDRILSYVARGLEPIRGFHVFMRTIPLLLDRYRDLTVVVVGEDKVFYGDSAPDKKSWRERYLAELGSGVDLSRVVFIPRLSRAELTALFQVTSAHVYYTYPFVLSWSMLEAMACGAIVVGSDTPPVREVIRDQDNGLLIPFFDREAAANTIARVLDDPSSYAAVARRGREMVVTAYDFATVSVPAYMRLIDHVMAGGDASSVPRRT